MALYDSELKDTLRVGVGRRTTDVIVLERIARGAGATRWYLVNDADSLAQTLDGLRPGSRVSIYFDGRIRRCDGEEEAGHLAEDVARREGEATVLWPGDAPNTLDADFLGGIADLRELFAMRDPDSIWYVGSFPAADDDGERAVTFEVPDADGVLRHHPH